MISRTVLCIMLTAMSCAVANPLADAIFHVNFGNNSADDTHGAISVAAPVDIEFVAVPPMHNGNGVGAYFNGETSGIAYGLGANDELKIEGSLTYHARVKFDSMGDYEQFIMGRFGKNNSNVTPNRVSYLQHFFTTGDIGGRLSVDGTAGYGHSLPVGAITPGVFYDIFFVFKNHVGTTNGYFKTVVYNAETKFAAGESELWRTGITSLYADSSIPFWIGMRGSHSGKIPFKGVIEQVNIWNRWLSDAEIEAFCGSGELICGQPGLPYLAADINRDCYVDILDLIMLAQYWLSDVE